MYKKIVSLTLACLIIVLCLISNSLINLTAYAKTDADGFDAKAVYLMDFETGEVLYEKNSQDKLPVASIVKLMTIYLTCKNLESGKFKLDEEVVASSTAASMGGSQVFIEEGGVYTIGDLLKSTIVSSANDASVLLAETISGSEENFVELMNTTATKLGLSNTHYSNCTGLPTVGQYSCAKDTAILLKEVIKFKDYHNYSTIWMDTLNHPNNRQTELVNTNKLIRYYEGCDGGKTGSTSEAGYCLVATAKRGNMRLIGSVLGTKNSKERFAQESKLFNYGFANFENKKVLSVNDFEDKFINVLNGKENIAKVGIEEDVYVLVNKNIKDDEIETKMDLNQTVNAPVKSGEKVGTVSIIKNGEVVKEVDIIIKSNIDKASYFDNIKNSLDNWQIA